MTKLKEIPFQESNIETIDFAIFNWVKNLNLHTNTNTGFEPTDVIWISAERAVQAKRSKEHHDSTGAVKYPLITVQRISMTKDPSRRGSAWAHQHSEKDTKGGTSITIARKINQEKTANFVNAETYKKVKQHTYPRKSNKVVYETYTIPMPVYVDVVYTIKIRTRFQTQMNELMQPFLTKTGGINYFTITHEGHRYECFIQQDFRQNNNIGSLGEEERKYETEIDIRTLGYLIGEGINQTQPKVVVRENAVEVKIPREYTVFGDIPDHTEKQTYVGIGGTGGEQYSIGALSSSS